MKNLIISALLVSLSIITIGIVSATEQNKVNNNSTFKTSREAVNQGKKDLLKLLSLKHEFNLNIKSSTLKKSRPGIEIAIYDVDFSNLLNIDNVTNLNKIANSANSNMTPLLDNGTVVAIIDTRKSEDGWKVSAIMNETIRKDIQKIGYQRIAKSGEKLQFYRIPNLSARVFAMNENNNTLYFSNYKGLSYKKPVDAKTITSLLKSEASKFNKLYGDKLKKERLLR